MPRHLAKALSREIAAWSERLRRGHLRHSTGKYWSNDVPTLVAAVNHQLLLRCAQRLAKAEEAGERDPPDVAAGTSLRHLRWLCDTAIENSPRWPLDKVARWLGFVQGVMSVRGLLDVNEERDYSRPLFRNAYEREGLALPDVLQGPHFSGSHEAGPPEKSSE